MCWPRVGEANPLFPVCIALWRSTALAKIYNVVGRQRNLGLHLCMLWIYRMTSLVSCCARIVNQNKWPTLLHDRADVTVGYFFQNNGVPQFFNGMVCWHYHLQWICGYVHVYKIIKQLFHACSENSPNYCPSVLEMTWELLPSTVYIHW
jgi:hypothetical protein